jgi:hypothetical protein
MATEDVLPGTLGKIDTSLTCCTTKFLQTGRVQFWNGINVDNDTGIVRLNTRFHFGSHEHNLKKLSSNVQVTTTCGYYSKFNYNVTVNLFFFRKNFGDSILKSYIRKLGSMVKENKKFDTQSDMATSAHRMMRMVVKEKNPEAFDKMMASAKVDTALQEAINEIAEKFTTKNSGSYSISHLTLSGTVFQVIITQNVQND